MKSVPKIIGNSASLKAALASARKVARTDMSVLVSGESGTGKELFARYIHDQSHRAEKPFIAINCAAIPAELLESELFGHERGAFSGAVAKKDGLIMQANGGTLFLDEIGDMSLLLQAKILRVLQERVVRPVGSKEEKAVDVRIVAASHRDLFEMAKEHKFREDLIHRLKGYSLSLPALRDRGRDIITLARYFLSKRSEFQAKHLSQNAREFLLQHSWPGNIRELQQAVLAAAVDSPRTIGTHHIQAHVANSMVEVNSSDGNLSISDQAHAIVMSMKIASLSEIRAKLCLPKTTAQRHIAHLEKSGKILRCGQGRKTQYMPCNAT